jgi:structural maintenance of chromosome 3 (chondroitin sulfate proteoglycan 6)
LKQPASHVTIHITLLNKVNNEILDKSLFNFKLIIFLKKGKINEISIAKDSFRLKILKEVAGSNVYDEKKEESRLILKETEEKQKSIVEVLTAIEDRLTQLEVEKEELKEFQKWDKMKRSIEYTIHNKELESTQSKLDDIQRIRTDSSKQSGHLYEELSRLGEELKRIEKLIRDDKQREIVLKEECEQLKAEKSTYLAKRARFEFDIKDAEEETNQAHFLSTTAQQELKTINSMIEANEKRLQVIRPEYDRIRHVEGELTQERDLSEQKRNEIYAKQGRSTRFRTKDERDAWIKNELKIIDKAITEKSQMAQKLNSELAQELKKCTQYRAEIQNIVSRSEEQQNTIDGSEREHFELLRRKDELQTKRNELWRTETQHTQEISQLREEQQRCEQSLRSITGRNLLQGIESVRTLIKQFKEEKKNLDIVDGYHGLLIENIECEKYLYTAVEASVGSRLFYHIVDNDNIAMRLLKCMNQQKLPGEVNCMPLSIIKSDGNEKIKYPDTSDAIPLISKLKYETKMETAIKYIFEKTLLCKDSEVATRYAKQMKMDCVLVDGDLVSRKGALTGGYNDTRQSKLSFYQQKVDLVSQIAQKEEAIVAVQAEIRNVDANLNNVLNDLQKHETKGKRNRDVHEQMRSDLSLRRAEIERIERQRSQKEQSANSLNIDNSQLQAKKEMLKAELGTELLKQISTDEQHNVDELSDRIHKLNQELKQTLNSRATIETEKQTLENQLENNFKRRKEELEQLLDENKHQTRSTKIELYRSELDLVNQKVEAVDNKLNDLSKQLDKLLKEDLHKLEKQQEKLHDQERKCQDDLQDSTVDLEKISGKLSLLLKKKDECLKATRNLGVLPQDAYEKYQEHSVKQLYVSLDKCNQELKKLSHVNKKAMDQFVQFSEHKEKLIQRREEADRAYKSILDFINTLDQRKNENMQTTFKQVTFFLFFDFIFEKKIKFKFFILK